jgi:hypothetical protein
MRGVPVPVLAAGDGGPGPRGGLRGGERYGGVYGGSDIHRDDIRLYAQESGLDSVAMVAIDADWSALRLKQV